MFSLTVDDATRALFNQAKGLAEIRDTSGNVIGFFAPVALEHAQHYASGAAKVNPLDLHRSKDEKDRGRSTEEVLANLNR